MITHHHTRYLDFLMAECWVKAIKKRYCKQGATFSELACLMTAKSFVLTFSDAVQDLFPKLDLLVKASFKILKLTSEFVK